MTEVVMQGSAILNAANANEDASAAILSTPEHDGLWVGILPLLEKEIGQTARQNWIDPLAFLELKDKTLYLSAPTRFMADWVRAHYADAIKRLLAAKGVTLMSLHITVDPKVSSAPVANQDDVSAPAAKESTDKSLGGRLDPKFTFERFIEDDSNALALAAARRVAEDAAAGFNPLFFYSRVGLGKTHLMHAIGHAIKTASPDRRVCYMSAEHFMYRFVSALREKDTVSFKHALRNIDVLIVDDIQFISGKTSTQQEFIHTFNALLDEGKQIIIAADKNPAEINDLDDRLKSRLSGGLTVDIQPASAALRQNVIRQCAHEAGVAIPEDVVIYLSDKIATNIRELEGALKRLLAYADLMKSKVTLDLTERVLSDLFRAHDRKVTIEDIQREVTSFYSLKKGDMTSARRLRAIARPRQLAMYLAKKMTPASLPEIGRQFGGRDHTTVMHAVRKIDDLLARDEGLVADLSRIEKTLKSL